MRITARIRRLIEEVSNRRIYKRLPKGADLFYDLSEHLPEFNARTIFDIGANVGQSTNDYLRNFSGAQVYCFEPASDTFAKLQDRFSDQPEVTCLNLALGAEKKGAELLLKGGSNVYRISQKEIEDKRDSESVVVETIDNFCEDHSIPHIDFMKIDTEGYDLRVLSGAERMIEKMEIDAIQVEASMNMENRRHVSFCEFVHHFEQHSYFLFALYDQINQFRSGKPILRRTNPVFLSEKLIEQNK